MKAKQLLFTMVAAAAVLAVGSDQALSAKGPTVIEAVVDSDHYVDTVYD